VIEADQRSSTFISGSGKAADQREGPGVGQVGEQLEDAREALGKVDLEAAVAKPSTSSCAACSGVSSAGMVKSFCAVSGVATKPGLITQTPMPCGARSKCRHSAKWISAALPGP
jgi:hypothetical protein